MKTKLLIFLFITTPLYIFGQDEFKVWNLQNCIEYALEQNIQLQKNKISLAEAQINTKAAKAQWQPSLSFSTGHNLTNNPWAEEGNSSSYSGSYSLGASWTVFNGFKRKYNINQQELQEDLQTASMESSEEEIKIAILTYYIQILYASENVKIKSNSLETAKTQLDRYKQLYEAGSASKSDYTQIESQYTSEEYQLITAQNDLNVNKLQLKQLLRLDLNQDIDIYTPEISEIDILNNIDNKDSIYERALSNRPEIKEALINEKIANLEIKSAKSGYYPTISLNGGISTGHNNRSTFDAGEQLKQNFGENIGISLNYAILDNRDRKSNVDKAKLNLKTSALNTEDTKDELKKTIETAYLDIKAAQASFRASLLNEKAANASYEIIKEKFDLGMKSPFEMLSERNTLLSAKQQTLQAKYTAILNIQILNIYQGLAITIE